MSANSKRKSNPAPPDVSDEAADDEIPKSNPKAREGAPAKKKKSGGRDAPPPESSFSSAEIDKLRFSLLTWYDANHRVLPWRRTPHSRRTAPSPAGPHESEHPAPASLDTQQFAYHVWVSEIMLQQTQVTTVLPYFARWVARWPTVAALAAADMEELRHAWAGLGYYRRAKYLLDGARHVMENLGGRFPETAAGLMGIPGVGPYTSAAIGSIAFNDKAAVVDGNVIRVLARLRALPGDPQRLMPTCSELAKQALHPERPGDFNQAVMELGATVCRPKNPDCGACPANHCCKAYTEWKAHCKKHGLPKDLPPYPLPTKSGGSGRPVSAQGAAPKSMKGKAGRKAEEEQGEDEVDEEEVDGEDGGVGEIEDGGGSLPYVTRFPGKKEAKEKQQQSVAVFVLEVLHPKQGPKASATEGAAKAGTGASSDSPQPKKRQRSMLDYASQGTKASKEAPDTADGGPSRSTAHTASLRGMDRRYLMVQRPEGSGLLAGLWEFPGTVLEAGCEESYRARKAHASPLLQKLLGPGFSVPGLTDDKSSRDQPVAGLGGIDSNISDAPGGARLVNREDVGTHVHIFSHIRQTNFVEVVRIAVDDLTAFEQALGIAQPSQHEDLEQMDSNEDFATKATGRVKRSNKAGGIKGDAKQEAKSGERPRTRWLSEDELLAACKGGRGNKAGGGNGVVGLSTGPRKIYALVSKVEKS
ncbi:hypothetical protein DUNSADRAFT_7494 [Dunaliella salina]|uniref:Adenine DNA glycosylase n=1 Tax=Dunaliella salina TaxID=3046 RepID=A0ABQ7GL83_DUNSA|nr:hypothetical protein DUNSADRAFT_7494 [Dunaliella salina]|eukprot:KAF5835367.1 hypothetical protein DUNSADRAFT_7494 [Dunaliella salina]